MRYEKYRAVHLAFHQGHKDRLFEYPMRMAGRRLGFTLVSDMVMQTTKMCT